MPESFAQPSVATASVPSVLRYRELRSGAVEALFQAYGLSLQQVPVDTCIPGSHWGDDEAGLIRSTLYFRADTPVHSIMHEGCHWLLMGNERRQQLHTDAGGSASEENAVCYLQILLARYLPEYSASAMCRDMDRWGYSFRLGSASAWFATDADDAKAFLLAQDFVTVRRHGECLTVDLPFGWDHSLASTSTSKPSES